VSAHFLLTAAARTLSVTAVARLGEEEAFRLFCTLRWHETDGEPVCPSCGCVAVYTYRARRVFKCKACLKQFSVTSGTIFHSRKLPIRDMLVAIAIFVNAVKGVSALQFGRDIDVSYKTAYVLAHKLREAMAADQATGVAKGVVEVDGAYFGGYVKPANWKENRRDRRLAKNQSGKRKVVVVMRERGGRTYPFVVKAEDEGVATVAKRVAPGSTIHADEAAHWEPCTPGSRRGASTTASSTQTARRVPIRPSRSSPACAGPRSASTTTSAAPILSSTPGKWRGARTIGAGTRERCGSWPA
jgi:transposase-like protein